MLIGERVSCTSCACNGNLPPGITNLSWSVKNGAAETSGDVNVTHHSWKRGDAWLFCIQPTSLTSSLIIEGHVIQPRSLQYDDALCS